MELPAPLQVLAGVPRHVTLDDGVPATQRGVLDALEARHPALRGTIRDPATGRRRPFVRFYAESEDHSDDGPDDPLPLAVTSGREAFIVLGAIAGG